MWNLKNPKSTEAEKNGDYCGRGLKEKGRGSQRYSFNNKNE
jgi:hypothetical protein